MNFLSIKSLATATVAALVAGTAVHYVQQTETGRLRIQNQELLAQQETVSKERDEAVAGLAARNEELAQTQRDNAELLRLRGEAGKFTRQSAELERLRDQNRKLEDVLKQSAQASPAGQSDEDASPERQAAMAKANDAKLLVLGLLMYANEHQEQLPDDLSSTTNYLAKNDYTLTGTNEFELLLRGTIKGVPHPADTIALREKTPTLRDGAWGKTYGFADGHVEFRTQPPEGFDAWEAQHIYVPPPGQ